jgi:hypothetical protein
MASDKLTGTQSGSKSSLSNLLQRYRKISEEGSWCHDLPDPDQDFIFLPADG